MFFKSIKICSYEVGLCFRNEEFERILSPGQYRFFDPFNRLCIDVVSQRDPQLIHDKLDLIVNSGMLDDRAEVVDLKDYQRGLVWIDKRFSQVLPPGLHVYWTGFKEVRVEVLDAREVRLRHDDLKTIVHSPNIDQMLDICTVERNHIGVSFQDGHYVDSLVPGQYAFWKDVACSHIVEIDMREQVLDVAGQEIMTADKVTLRMNALVTYRVENAPKAVMATEDVTQSLYRQAQLALRAVVGAHDLDSFLTDKDAVTNDFAERVRLPASAMGLEIVSVGMRDVILPGEMKVLMNKVTEAKKAAEANLISRREETAAMRSQANTARLLADNPTLMRLRELEVLEKVATTGKLNVLLGEKGLTDRIVNLL